MDIYTLSGLTVVGMGGWAFDGEVPSKIIGLRVNERRKAIMATGTLKWFNESKGFGFIQPDDGGVAVFARRCEFLVDIRLLECDQKVSYELMTDEQDRLMASKIERL